MFFNSVSSTKSDEWLIVDSTCNSSAEILWSASLEGCDCGPTTTRRRKESYSQSGIPGRAPIHWNQRNHPGNLYQQTSWRAIGEGSQCWKLAQECGSGFSEVLSSLVKDVLQFFWTCLVLERCSVDVSNPPPLRHTHTFALKSVIRSPFGAQSQAQSLEMQLKERALAEIKTTNGLQKWNPPIQRCTLRAKPVPRKEHEIGEFDPRKQHSHN